MRAVTTDPTATTGTDVPWRRTLAALGGVTSLSAAVGTAQLLTGTFTPPVSDLEPLGLESWVLPGVWLGASVAVPCGVVAWLGVRRSPRVGPAAVVAGSLLAVELVAQVPFVGPDPLQVVMGGVAAGLLTLGTLARRASGSPGSHA